MSQPKLLIVTDGLIPSTSGYAIHPQLDPWRKRLLRCSRSWFESAPKTALEWYGLLQGLSPTKLLLNVARERIPNESTQVWIASPYHAQLARDRIMVMPDSLLPWREEDAAWICDLLNPLLKEEGIELLHHKAALLLACENPINARPDSFAAVSGKMLPNRHPEGADGGRLMRLMAEIQMVLSLKPAEHRRAAGEPDIHGLWLWGGEEISSTSSEVDLPSVATRDAQLASATEAKDAEVTICDADQLSLFSKPESGLAKHILIAGQGQAVLLKSSMFPRFGSRGWQARPSAPENALILVLRCLK